MGKIRLNESDLRKIIAESVRKVILNEAIDIAKGVPEKYRKAYLEKMIREYPDLDPDGFFWLKDTLKHNGKKKRKYSVEKISKPKGMSEEEYEKEVVIPNNEKYAKRLSEYPDEEFRPIVNSGRYFRGEADYSQYYEISNYGRLKVLDLSDASKCRIVDGYDAPTSRAMQFNLNGDQHTCPPVHSMVADAWLEPKDPHDFMVRHKNGDYHDNRVENLEWVPRKNRRNNLSVKLKDGR